MSAPSTKCLINRQATDWAPLILTPEEGEYVVNLSPVTVQRFVEELVYFIANVS